MENENVTMPILYVGLTNLPLGEVKVDFGEGIVLRSANATFISPLVLVNTDEKSMVMPVSMGGQRGYSLPKPAFWQFAGERAQITAELAIPNTVQHTLSQQLALARFIVSILRL